jgi:excisionase family DNA binding protein
MSNTLTPAQAAQRSGVSRWTIMRAIKATEIQALRDNHNHWKINEKSFENWCDARGAHTVHAQDVAQDAHVSAQVDGTDKIRIAELEVETRMLKDQLDEVKEDREAWKRQAERLSAPRIGLFGNFFRKPK